MKNKKFIEAGKLFVTRVRVVLENDPITGAMRTAHCNDIGYRLFYKKNDNTYIDILTGKKYPVLSEKLQIRDLFLLNPKPFWVYAHSLREKERIEDIMEIARYVNIHFNANLHNEKKWKETKDVLHKIHHRNDNDFTL